VSKLEKASHVSVILVSVASLVCLLPALKKSVFPSPREAATSTLVGRKLELPGVQWAPGGASVVIAMNSKCPFCIASLPVYAQLSSLAGRSGGRLSLLVASTTPDISGVEKLLTEHGVRAVQIVESSTGALHVSGTPTTFIVDRSGVVRWVHLGQMDDSREKELLRVLKML